MNQEYFYLGPWSLEKHCWGPESKEKSAMSREPYKFYAGALEPLNPMGASNLFCYQD